MQLGHGINQLIQEIGIFNVQGICYVAGCRDNSIGRKDVHGIGKDLAKSSSPRAILSSWRLQVYTTR